jgi:hypothetical protein
VGVTGIKTAIEVRFSKKHAVVFHLFGCKHTLIDDVQAPGREIISRNQSNQWDKDLAVVTEVITANRGTVLISEEKNAELDLEVGAKVGVNGLNLANLGGEFTETKKSSLSIKLVAKENLTPLYVAHRIKRVGFFRPTKKFTPIFALGDTSKPITIDVADEGVINARPSIFLKRNFLKMVKISAHSYRREYLYSQNC